MTAPRVSSLWLDAERCAPVRLLVRILRIPGRDAPPVNLSASDPNPFAPCTIGGIVHFKNAESLSCPAPATTTADDTASSMSASTGLMANRVTVHACYVWTPPLPGSCYSPRA